jgi:hypothetical protein
VDILAIATIASTAGLSLVRRIQLDERTRDALFKIVTELQSKLGRRVTFDEAIMSLMDETREVNDARSRFEALFGSLRGDRKAWDELESLRRTEAKRLDRF